MTAYSRSELDAWDQRVSLRPCPYKFGMKRLLGGIQTGDPLFDGLPAGKLACHGKEAAQVPQQEEPAWLDREQLERGQELWNYHLSRAFTALALSLLSGFSIARFGEVLLKNGYAQDGRTAMFRYMETGFAITDWYRFDMLNPESPARKSVYTVRAMHALARRNSANIFSKEHGEGIPLSQFDMAEVQLGFSGICMSVIESELGYGKIKESDARDMCYFWRYLGYHLGIMDEFNVCNSFEDMQACTADFMAWTPRRFETPRPSTLELRRTAIEGFAMQTGLGENFWYAALDMVFDTPRLAIEHLRPPKKFLPGVDIVTDISLKAFGYDPVAKLVHSQLVNARETKRSRPDVFNRRLRFLMHLSRLNDMLIWRLISAIHYARYVIVAYLSIALAKRVRVLVL